MRHDLVEAFGLERGGPVGGVLRPSRVRSRPKARSTPSRLVQHAGVCRRRAPPSGTRRRGEPGRGVPPEERGDSVVSGISERREQVAPGPCGVRETVKADHEPAVARTAFEQREIDIPCA